MREASLMGAPYLAFSHQGFQVHAGFGDLFISGLLVASPKAAPGSAASCKFWAVVF